MNSTQSSAVKLIFTVLLLFLVSASSGAQISLSAGGGLNTAKINGCKGNLRFGYQLGAYVDYAFNTTFSLRTGLVLNNKGTDDFDNKVNAGINALYLDVPLMGNYSLRLRDNAILVISTGPYLAYGMGGTTRIEEFNPVVGTAPVEYVGELMEYSTFTNRALKRWDFGWGVDVGIQHNSIWLGIRNQYGLFNISNIANRTAHNQSFALTFAYRFYQK